MKQIPMIFFAGSDGSSAKGFMTACPDCGNDTFRVCTIHLSNGDHNHLICVGCNSSFCNGDCKDGVGDIVIKRSEP